MPRIIGYIAFLFCISGCSLTPQAPETEPPQESFCSKTLIIDGVREEFCGSRTNNLSSRLQAGEGLYVQYDANSLFFLRSDNYLAYRIAFANTPPDSNDFAAEILFFSDLLELMQPESLHPFDLSVKGGFAIEVWDKNGTYYSTELGPQLHDAQIGPGRVTFDLNGPITGPVYSFMVMHLTQQTAPAVLWNDDNTKYLEVVLGSHQFMVSFRQFR